jgi:hypothetical protein
MSAWSLGRRQGSSNLAGGNTLKTYVDHVVQWIPADVIAIFTLGITALKSQHPDPNPSWAWLVIAAVLSPLMVVLGSLGTGAAALKITKLAVLAIPAFGIWSLAIPDSGWYAIDWVKSNPGWVAALSAVAGLVFAPIAGRLGE